MHLKKKHENESVEFRFWTFFCLSYNTWTLRLDFFFLLFRKVFFNICLSNEKDFFSYKFTNFQNLVNDCEKSSITSKRFELNTIHFHPLFEPNDHPDRQVHGILALRPTAFYHWIEAICNKVEYKYIRVIFTVITISIWIGFLLEYIENVAITMPRVLVQFNKYQFGIDVDTPIRKIFQLIRIQPTVWQKYCSFLFSVISL